jgi:hypothetical protein
MPIGTTISKMVYRPKMRQTAHMMINGAMRCHPIFGMEVNMTTHTHIGNDTLQVCFNALDILIENDKETISGFMGSDWDTDYLYQVLSEGPCADYDQTDLDNIEAYLDRFNAKLSIMAILNVE